MPPQAPQNMIQPDLQVATIRDALQKIGGDLQMVQQQLMNTVYERKAELDADQVQSNCWVFLSDSMSSMARLVNELSMVQQYMVPPGAPQMPAGYAQISPAEMFQQQQQYQFQLQQQQQYYMQQQVPSTTVPQPLEGAEINDYSHE